MTRSKQFKLLSAGVGAGAVVAMAVLNAGVADIQDPTGAVNSAPGITLGGTVTTTTPPAQPVVSHATPPFTFTTPSGFAAPH